MTYKTPEAVQSNSGHLCAGEAEKQLHEAGSC